MDETFYRQLFFKRYSLLLEKVENTYKVDEKTMDRIRSKILTLTWIDPGIEKLKKC